MSTIKVTVALNSMGQVAAATRQAAPSDVTSGMVADLGQTLVELEVASTLAEMDAARFLSHLAEHASIKSATAHLTAPSASGEEVTTGSL